MRLAHIDHVAITVSDVARSAAWYRDVLGLERRHEGAWGGEPPWMMCAGDTCVALFPPAGRLGEAPSPRTTITMRHFAFVTDRAGFDEARTEADSKGLAPEFQDHEICHSIYISDPDGHRIEITTYEI